MFKNENLEKQKLVCTKRERKSCLKVGVVELVGDVPAQHEELSSLQQHRVEVAEGEEKLLVLLWLMAASELSIRHHVVQTLQVGFQPLLEKSESSFL